MMNRVLERYNEAKSAVVLSVFGNLGLGIFKLLAGVFGNSLAVVADSIDTISDVLVSIVVWIGLKIGIKPRDGHHHFGHGDTEPVAGLIISMFLVIIGFEFAKFTMEKVFAGAVYIPETIALVAMAVSAVVKYWMYHFTMRAGERTNSPALITNAYNYKGDFYRSIAILVGVFATRFVSFFDPVIGVLVSVWIIWTGISQGKQNILSIMGTLPSDGILKDIKRITRGVKGVRGIHDIRVHYIGVYAFANLHVKVNPRLTIHQAHDIASEVETKIKQGVESITTVSVHTEP